MRTAKDEFLSIEPIIGLATQWGKSNMNSRLGGTMPVMRNLIYRLVWSGLVTASIICPLDGRTGVFRDDFEDDNLDGWQIEFWQQAGLWEIVVGTVESKRKSPESTYLTTGKENWKDYTISCDMILKENFGQK